MSGRDVKPRLPRMPGQRARPSLIAAAEAHSEDAVPEPSRRLDLGSRRIVATTGAEGSVVPETHQDDSMDVDLPVNVPEVKPEPSPAKPPAKRPVPAASTAPIAQSRSTTVPSDRSRTTTPAAGEGSSVPKLKFKPKMPVRRAAQEPEVVKSEPGVSVRGRPAARARGRGAGAARGGRGGAAANTIAAGPFGGSRASSSRRVVAPPPPPRYAPDPSNVEVYSDNEDGTRAGVIDIEAVSALSESAPTSVYRDRDLDGVKAKAKEMEKAKLKDLKKRRKTERAMRAAAMASAAGSGAGMDISGEDLLRVKAEPVSPVHGNAILPDPNAGVPPPLVRVGDSMIPADEQQDRDAEGRRIRAVTSGTTGTIESDEVNAAHAVDLSESESEEEIEDMEGDFVFAEGMDNPEDKLFTFQFPSNMPKFVVPPTDVMEVDETAPETKPDIKPTPAMLKNRRKNLPPPEGRVGTLCVMRSGKVKMVMGEGPNAIVMNVAPGVPNTFLQQLVHVDNKGKGVTVLGEVHKQYVVTPDLDRLLEELFINGGETPGDRERVAAERERRLRAERGLVKMEPSSP